MKAENLTICVPADCDQHCPYCISEVTWYPEPSARVFWRNLHKALQIAKAAQVSRVLITSKGEPLNREDWVIDVLLRLGDFVTELQTNGISLIQHPSNVIRYAGVGLNVLAYSIDHLDKLKHLYSVSEQAREFGITTRATMILTKKEDYAETLHGIIMFAKEMLIDQVTLRIPTVPEDMKNTEQGRWIAHSVDLSWIEDIECQLMDYRQVRILPFDDVRIRDAEGLSVTFIPNCLQEVSTDADIRSLIYHQDGHMYTSWASPGSRVF